MSGQLKRSSLGRTAFIGELYDARQEAFSSQSLLRSGYPESLVERRGAKHMEFEYRFTENVSDRFELLKVEAELQVGVLLKLVEVDGSGSFLQEESSSARSVSCALVCRIVTVCEKLFAAFGDIVQHVDLGGLRRAEFTHFVTEITWGANCLLSLTATCKEERTREELRGKLSAKLRELKGVLSVGGGGGLEKGRAVGELGEEVAVRVCADVVPEGEWPTTVKGFQEFVAGVPKLLQKCNGGKGKPLAYVMSPLGALREAAGLSLRVEAVVRSIDESFLVSSVCFFEEVAEVRRRVNDVVGAMEEMRKYVGVEELRRGRSVQEALGVRESEAKRIMSEEWVEVRSGRKELRELVRRMEKFKGSEMKLSFFEDFLESSGAVLRRLGRVREYLSRGVVYLGRGDDFECVFAQNLSCEFLVLLVSSEAEAENPILHSENTAFFLLEASNPKTNTKYVVVDFDYRADRSFMGADATTCLRLHRGKVRTYDAYGDHLAHAMTSFIRLKPNAKFCCTPNRPSCRVPLEISCPARRCSSAPRKWVCFHCSTDVEYGFDEHFYCSCGSATATAFDFRCSEDSHGHDFVSVEPSALTAALSALRPLEELNILVLGQSGTGKSTWINSIVNYLNFHSLQDAQRHGVIVTIPGHFCMSDPSRPSQVHTIRIGDEEDRRVGDSITRHCHTYSFLWGEKNIRIIDTPGLGDSAGIDQDKRNLANIVTHLGYLKELHAVCILIKTNETVINPVFSYCLKELLAHLHKDVARNILFCFTNARASFYSPGSGSVLLRKVIDDLGVSNLTLGDSNMFCLDNEAFLFLCSLGHPEISHSPEVVRSFSESWEKSLKETLRLFTTIVAFQPHRLQDTLSLVTARNRILNLSKPILDISSTVELNLRLLQQQKEKIRASDQTVEKLSKNLHFKEVYLETEPLKYPRTVCTSPSCIEYLSFTGVDVKEIEYKTHCHPHCNLKNVEVATVNNPLLLECDAMKGGKCEVCGCGWEKHMHIANAQVRKEREVLNTDTQERIRKVESDKEKLEVFVKEIGTKISEYQEEKKFIFDASLKFGMFLRRNSISVYNDSVVAYLRYLIDAEEGKLEKSPTEEDLLRSLKDTLAHYQEEIKVLMEVVQREENAEAVLTVEGVLQLEKDLYKLKNWGENIKSIVEAEAQAQHKMAEYRETPLRLSRAPSAGTSGAESMFGKIKSNLKKAKMFLYGGEEAAGGGRR